MCGGWGRCDMGGGEWDSGEVFVVKIIHNIHFWYPHPSPIARPYCAIPNVMDHVVYVGQVLQDDPSDPCHYL